MKQYTFTINSNPYSVKILELSPGSVTAEVNGSQHTVTIEEIENLAMFSTPGHDSVGSTAASANACATDKKEKRPAPRTAPSVFGSDNVTAPIPGQIIAIDVEPGREIEKGQPVLVLEAMKMENIITAKRTGVIEEVCVAVGDAVTQDQVLVTMS